MKRKHLLFTLLLALMVPLAAFAQVERTVTVFNGNDINAHIPVDGGHGTLVPAKNQFIMDKDELSDLAGKQITKMTFHVVNSNITMKDGDHLPYSVLLAEVDYTNFGNAGLLTENLTNAYTVASGVELELTGNTLVINFSRAYTYSGNKNLLVQFSCSSATNYFTPFYESYELRFFGVNAIRAGIADLGMGIYRHFGFVPKTTFTYMDEATWANTNRPRNLQVQADSDGYRLNVSWQAPANYSGSYQALCVAHGTTPDWSNAETTSNTSTFFSQLNSNTAYDIYVRAKSALMISAPAKAIAMTKHIANLDNGNLILDFDDAYIHNGITATGDYSHRLDISRYWYTDSGYGSYHMQCPIGTVTLPSLSYQDANNGVIMEFDLTNATDLQVQFYKQGNTTTLGTFSANSWTHYTVRAIDGLGAQNTAYFQLVSSNAFDIDNIRIYKAPTTMKPYNLQASNITTNSATITWDDDNTGTVTHYLRYKKTTDTEWQLLSSLVTSPYVLTGNTSNPLETYTQYEVQLMAQRSSTDYSDWTDSFVFATACPATQTTYTQSFTNLSDLPSYWRVAKGEGVNYSVNNNRLTVSNTSYQNTSYDYTYTSYTTLDAYVIMPYFEDLQSLQLSFKAGRTAGSYNELVVGVMSDPFDVTNFSILETRVLNGPTTTYNFNLANAAYTHGYIAIKLNHYENNLQNVWFDDFVVTRFDEPTELTVSNVTNTSAIFSWTTNASSVEIRYKKTTENTWTTVTPDANPYTLTGLTNNTDYEAQIRANYGAQYSDWASFQNFTTYYSAPVLVDPTHPYSFGFQVMGLGTTNPSDGGWEIINDNGLYANNWVLGTAPGTMSGSGSNNYSMYISYNGTAYQYIHGTDSYGQWHGAETTNCVARVFTLTPGSYEFSYSWKAKGIHDKDYFRVVLVPDHTTLPAGSLPSGLSYNSLPQGWIALDGGEALNPMSGSLGFATYTTPSNSRIDIMEEGNYMMVFVWHNTAEKLTSVQNPPVAIDNIVISCISLIEPPTTIAVDEESDTEVALSWTAPSSGFTPTGYQVQYEPQGNNGFEGAPIVDANTNAVTLTGLTPHTNYQVRVRSTYTAGGNTIYSDWTDPVAFTTLYPRPTNLTLIDQTSSWASMMWDAVVVELEDGQYLGYSYQLTTDPDNWGTTHDGVAGNVWSLTLAPGTYYFRVQTVVRDSNSASFRSPWSESITFTIASWTNAVTVFPLTYDFEGSHFDDGITLGGNVDDIRISMYYNSGVSPHDGNENENMLRFNSGANGQAYLVLPPLHPSTGNALVSFWWYHHSGHQNYQNTNINDGVEVESSTDGQSWSTVSYGMIPRYDTDYSGWKKYDFVFPATANPTYVRLHFRGTTGSWLYCYLDDLTVNTFQSQQPYISYVGCDANTATITLYDYAYDNGWPSSDFQVQYRKVGKEWSDNNIVSIANTEPAFQKYLTVENLDPNTYYEFRARARVSYNSFGFPWSNYCEPYRQWTSDGTYIVSPGHSYEMDFEYGAYNWTLDPETDRWDVQHDGAYQGNYCAYCPGSTSLNDQAYLTSPEINFSGCDNVILRFWSKGKGIIRVYYGVDYADHGDICTLTASNDWTKVELSLSYFMNKGPIKVCFYRQYNNTTAWYVDDISIIANAYGKIFDCKWNEVGLLSSGGNWYPQGVPSATDEVMIMRGSQVYYRNSPFSCGTINFGTTGSVWVRANCMLTVTTFNATNRLTVEGTANITTLNPGEANSVVVNKGGVLNVTTINGEDVTYSPKVVIKDGGQVKSANPFFATIEKNITGYGAENVNERIGWNLIATPTAKSVNQVLVPMNGDEFLFNQMDLYWFNQGADLEWVNAKTETGNGTVYGLVTMMPKKGYLYARQDDGTLQFEADMGNNRFPATTTAVEVNSLDYTAGANFAGWNLIGNPFTCNAFVTDGTNLVPFYRMNADGDAIVLADAQNGGNVVKPCEGVFVQVTSNNGSVDPLYFSSTEPVGNRGALNFTLLKQSQFRGEAVEADRVRISFGEGQNLGHLDLMADPNRLYIPLKDKDMAVVHSAPVGEMPLNFEAAENGNYTLSVNLADTELLYCHLIDNLSGADVDLLQQPEYNFSAKTTDYASRFKLVFATGSSEGTEADTFGFINASGNFCIFGIEGEATVQVIDMLGHVISSEIFSGSYERKINGAPGVYVVRLINGENVRVQKVVVR